MKRLPAGVALLCAALAGTSHAAATEVPRADPCPGAAAWAAAHPDESDEARAARDPTRSFTEPQLRAELDARSAREQKARIAMLANRRNERARREVVLADESNFKWLAELVRTGGFPTAAQVGEEGVEKAWLLLHHADAHPDFQAALLTTLGERTAAGELRAARLAQFTDRVLVGHGRAQRYGTQFSPEGWRAPHFGLDDEASLRAVEDNRRALGVMPLADYVCMMSEARK